MRELRDNWFDHKKEQDAENESERQASAAETRANEGEIFGV